LAAVWTKQLKCLIRNSFCIQLFFGLL
jgi:hypothetical protein